jgi:hypothetical protein
MNSSTSAVAIIVVVVTVLAVAAKHYVGDQINKEMFYVAQIRDMCF